MQAKHALSASQLKLLYGAVQTHVVTGVLEGLLEPTPAKPTSAKPTPAKPTPAAGLSYFRSTPVEEFLPKNKPAWRNTTTVAEAHKSPSVASTKEPNVKNVPTPTTVVDTEEKVEVTLNAPAAAPGAKINFAQKQSLAKAFDRFREPVPPLRCESTNETFRSLSPTQMGSVQGTLCRARKEQYERIFNEKPSWHSATNEPSATAHRGYTMQDMEALKTPSPVKSPGSFAADSSAADSSAERIKRSRRISPDKGVWMLLNESKHSTPEGAVETLVETSV